MKSLQQMLQNRCFAYVEEIDYRDESKVALKKALCQKRNSEIKSVKAVGKITSREQQNDELKVHYDVHFQYFMKHNDLFYMEEEKEQRMASFKNDECISDREVQVERPHIDFPIVTDHERSELEFCYDRVKAVQYANMWWDGTNPEYQRFNDDCTNYISQCLRAGGAPMRGMYDRTYGWWYSGDNWSYSWTVSNALYVYLTHSTIGLRAREVESPEQLLLGDLIFYDFEGDGRYNHCTIVTAKDDAGMPLVNAHTTDSRQRYWSYEDSTAYTPQMIYAFFTIVDDA